MKIFFVFMALASSPISWVHATDEYPKEIKISGPAAAELYEHLNILETRVRDQQGIKDPTSAKYGNNFGCQKNLADGSVECWIFQ